MTDRTQMDRAEVAQRMGQEMGRAPTEPEVETIWQAMERQASIPEKARALLDALYKEEGYWDNETKNTAFRGDEKPTRLSTTGNQWLNESYFDALRQLIEATGWEPPK